MLDQIGTHGLNTLALALGVAVKPHAFGVPLTRFQGWTAHRRARQGTLLCRDRLKLALSIILVSKSTDTVREIE